MPTVDPEVAKILADMEASTLDIAEARSMPPAAYTSPAFYTFEKEALFGRTWLCVGHQNQIANNGDYFGITVADEPLLIVRRANGEIGAMSAICRHRGHPICQFDDDRQGNTRTFQCPYHSWTYDLEGQLIGAPDMERTVDPDVLAAETHLPTLAVELFHGFIFVNFDLEAAPLSSTLGKLDAELSNYDIADMVVMPTQTDADLPWNWKIMHENGLEPYHTSYVHAGYHDMAPAHLSTFIEWNAGDGQVMHPTGFVHKDGGFNPRKTAPFPIIPTLSEEQRQRTIFGSVPPTLFFCLMPDQVFTFLILPQGPETMTLLLNFYYPQSTVDGEHFAWAYQGQHSITNIFGQQDERTNAMLQKGMRSRFAPRGRYSHLEGTLPQFNRWLMERFNEHTGESGKADLKAAE